MSELSAKQPDDRQTVGGPLVSILIVARNTGPFIGDAILSARQQSYRDIEVIVVDDDSTDDTREIAESHAAKDPRVRVLDGPRAGLAAIRNVSLAAAQGRWAAVLDSDDLLHPRHVERLVAAAEATGAEITAANMVSFSTDAGVTRTELFADQPDWRNDRWLTPVAYVKANSASGDAVSAGYLKPLFDLAFLRRHDLEYDLRLRIAEDYDLVARALAAGARFRFLSQPTYFYRRHELSTSHRLSLADLAGMLATADAAASRSDDAALKAAVAERARGIRSALRHAKAVAALKARAPHRALAALGADIRAWRLMGRSAMEGGSRRLSRGRVATSTGAPTVLVIGHPDPDGETGKVLAVMAREGRSIAMRAVPQDDGERARLGDGLSALTHIFVAPPATIDDAAYAMAPALPRTIDGSPAGA